MDDIYFIGACALVIVLSVTLAVCIIRGDNALAAEKKEALGKKAKGMAMGKAMVTEAINARLDNLDVGYRTTKRGRTAFTIKDARTGKTVAMSNVHGFETPARAEAVVREITGGNFKAAA